MAGETDVTLLATSPLLASRSAGAVIAAPYTVELTTGMMETDDLTAICRVPANATVIAFNVWSDDLDTDDSVALVWDILIGDTTFVAGIANDTAKAGTTVVGSSGHVTVTSDTIVYIKAATAAATAAGGTFQLTPFYFTAN